MEWCSLANQDGGPLSTSRTMNTEPESMGVIQPHRTDLTFELLWHATCLYVLVPCHVSPPGGMELHTFVEACQALSVAKRRVRTLLLHTPFKNVAMAKQHNLKHYNEHQCI